MRSWPALDVCATDSGLLLAAVDDFSPTAAEERGDGLRLFFATTQAREAARAALAPRFDVDPIDVPDEDWVRRSQQNLAPITVGRITVAPPWAGLKSGATTQASSGPESGATSVQPRAGGPSPLTIVIEASMGFGTGHHATTRLCLAAIQTVDLTDAFVLDVGTGSGVLAIAAARLGAARALGIDSDADAIGSARQNLALNAGVRHVAFEVADLTSTELPAADVVTANLTGTLLVRAAAPLAGAVRPGGTLVLGGLLVHERSAVVAAFEKMALRWEKKEDEWVGLSFKGQGSPSHCQTKRTVAGSKAERQKPRRHRRWGWGPNAK